MANKLNKALQERGPGTHPQEGEVSAIDHNAVFEGSNYGNPQGPDKKQPQGSESAG